MSQAFLFPDPKIDETPTPESGVSGISTATGDRGEYFFDFWCHEKQVKALRYISSSPRIDRVIETSTGKFLKIHIKTSTYQQYFPTPRSQPYNRFTFNFRKSRVARDGGSYTVKYSGASKADYFVCIGILPEARIMWWLPYDEFWDCTVIGMVPTSKPEYQKTPEGILPSSI